MSPLTPTGAWTQFTAEDRPLTTDEWNDEFPPDPHPAMSRAELNEAANRLSGLHHLVGEQAAEVVALLVVLLHRRDGASMAILRWLRGLDNEARS